jgi:predicted transcriptional regulator
MAKISNMKTGIAITTFLKSFTNKRIDIIDVIDIEDFEPYLLELKCVEWAIKRYNDLHLRADLPPYFTTYRNCLKSILRSLLLKTSVNPAKYIELEEYSNEDYTFYGYKPPEAYTNLFKAFSEELPPFKILVHFSHDQLLNAVADLLGATSSKLLTLQYIKEKEGLNSKLLESLIEQEKLITTVNEDKLKDALDTISILNSSITDILNFKKEIENEQI